MNKSIVFAIVFILLISNVFAVGTADSVGSATLVSPPPSPGGGGGGAAPVPLSITEVQASLTSTQISAVNSELAALLAEFGDNIPQEKLAELQAKLKAQGITLSTEQIQAWSSSLPTIKVIQGGAGGTGFPTDEGLAACNVEVTPLSVQLNVDKIAAQISIKNLESKSISPTFGLYPLENQPSAIPYIALRGEISQVLPQDTANIVVVTYPATIVNLTENYGANLRVIIPNCKYIDVPIKITSGGLFSFIGTDFGGSLGGFMSYFIDIISKTWFTIGGFGVKYSYLGLFTFGILVWLLRKNLTIILNIAFALLLSAIITVAIYTIMTGS